MQTIIANQHQKKLKVTGRSRHQAQVTHTVPNSNMGDLASAGGEHKGVTSTPKRQLRRSKRTSKSSASPASPPPPLATTNRITRAQKRVQKPNGPWRCTICSVQLHDYKTLISASDEGDTFECPTCHHVLAVQSTKDKTFAAVLSGDEDEEPVPKRFRQEPSGPITHPLQKFDAIKTEIAKKGGREGWLLLDPKEPKKTSSEYYTLVTLVMIWVVT